MLQPVKTRMLLLEDPASAGKPPRLRPVSVVVLLRRFTGQRPASNQAVRLALTLRGIILSRRS